MRCPQVTPEDLKKMVEVAELIVAGKDPHVPVQRLIKAMAITILTLRDEVEDGAHKK